MFFLQMHAKKKSKGKNKSTRHMHKLKAPYHMDVVKLVKTPALYFCFSRAKTQDFAVELARKLTEAKKQFDMQFYVDKAHSIRGENTRYHLFTKLTNFVEENL